MLKWRAVGLLSVLLLGMSAFAQQSDKADAAKKADVEKPKPASIPDSTTESSVTVGGQKIAYKAVAGTI